MCVNVYMSTAVPDANGCYDDIVGWDYCFEPRPKGVEYHAATAELTKNICQSGEDTCQLTINGEACQACSLCDSGIEYDCTNLQNGYKSDGCDDIDDVWSFQPFERRISILPSQEMDLYGPYSCQGTVCSRLSAISGIDQTGCIGAVDFLGYTFLPFEAGSDDKYEESLLKIYYRESCPEPDACFAELDGEDCLSCSQCNESRQSLQIDCSNLPHGLKMNKCSKGKPIMPFTPVVLVCQESSTCSKNSDCCNGYQCQDSQCSACTGRRQACTQSDECCGDLECRRNKCLKSRIL